MTTFCCYYLRILLTHDDSAYWPKRSQTLTQETLSQPSKQKQYQSRTRSQLAPESQVIEVLSSDDDGPPLPPTQKGKAKQVIREDSMATARTHSPPLFIDSESQQTLDSEVVETQPTKRRATARKQSAPPPPPKPTSPKKRTTSRKVQEVAEDSSDDDGMNFGGFGKTNNRRK